MTAPDPDGASRRIGNYEVLGEVGRGGMGVVYQARQIGLKRLVALKMILTGADAGPHERARFRTEAEAAARLQPPTSSRFTRSARNISITQAWAMWPRGAARTVTGRGEAEVVL